MSTTDDHGIVLTTTTDTLHDEEDIPDHDQSQSQPLLPVPNTTSGSLTRHGGSLIIHPHDDNDGYSYAYGPKGLAGLRHNRFALLCAVFASIGGLTFGYDQGVIANVLVMHDFTERWPIGPWEKGLMSTFCSSFSRGFWCSSLDCSGGVGVGGVVRCTRGWGYG
jgi:hypothetical protein